jgi:hypothetical protein
MLQDERISDEQTALRTVLSSWQLKIWTSLPGILQSFDGHNASVQPAIKGRIRSPNGIVSDVPLPLLINCPVLFPSGGGYSMTLPLAKGNEGVVFFSSRCIDGWWQSGGVQSQIELRMHHLSDGFFFPGVRSVPNALSGVSTTAAQLRSEDGTYYLEVDSTTGRARIVTPNSTVDVDSANNAITLTTPGASVNVNGSDNTVSLTATNVKIISSTLNVTTLPIGPGAAGDLYNDGDFVKVS